MDLYDSYRAAIDQRADQLGRKRSAILVGSTFSLALLDEMEKEVQHIGKGNPRTSSEILNDAFSKAQTEFIQYQEHFHKEFDLLDVSVVRHGVKSYNSLLQWRDHSWLLPIFQGVITNFAWLAVCMVLVWLAFAIKQDWPSVVQGWFI